MIKLLVGFILGVCTIVFFPDALSWFVESGIRDTMIERLNSL